MRQFENIFEVRPAWTGILCATNLSGASRSCIGNVIDTMGFGMVMAVLSIGHVQGTAAAPCALVAKFQECAVVDGSTSQWSDITDGDPCGSFGWSIQIPTTLVGVQAVTSADVAYVNKETMKLQDTNRKRYIRVVAEVTNTAANGHHYVPLSINVLLGHPIDSTYVSGQNRYTRATGNTEYLDAGIFGSSLIIT